MTNKKPKIRTLEVNGILCFEVEIDMVEESWGDILRELAKR